MRSYTVKLNISLNTLKNAEFLGGGTSFKCHILCIKLKKCTEHIYVYKFIYFFFMKN